MTQATRAGAAQWARFLFVAALLGAIAFACVSSPLAPLPGLRDADSLAYVPVPGGLVNAAGGNFFLERRDLELDTRLGTFSVGASYNSSWGWTFSFDSSYRNGSFRDASGAQHALGALPDGAAVAGTHWVKVDAARVKTKGGLLHEFEPASGRLVALRWASADYPRLRFVQSQLGAVWRTTAIEQCTSASACTNLFSLSYDANARLTQIQDRAGRVAAFLYDAKGKLATARDGFDVANGRPGARYEYAGALLAAITSSDGERVEIVSDGSGRATQVRALGAGDPVWTFSYAPMNAAALYVTTLRDPLGNATAYAFDGARALRALTNALGETTAYGWAAGRVASVTRPDGTRTTYTVVDDDVVSELRPSGNVVTYTYAAHGVDRERPNARAVLRIADSLGARETRSYDAAGRLLTVANGAGETTTYGYHPDQSIASVRSPDGTQLRLDGYADHGHPVLFTLVGGSSAVVRYDAVGNAWRTSWPGPSTGGAQRIDFDADRQPAAIELLDQPASGAPSTERIVFERRADGRPRRVLRPYGGETRFSYDALGRLVLRAELASPTESADRTAWSATTWAYDALGRVTAMERANGMREELAYDALGRVVRARALRGGVVEADVAFEYASGRLVRVHDALGFEERYAYDAAGRLAEAVHALGEATRFAYDARSRPIRTELLMPGGAPLAALTHAYDLADREIALFHLGASLVARRYVDGQHDETSYGNGLRRKQFRDTKSGRAAGRELWRGATRLERSDYTLRPALGGEATTLRTEIMGASAAAGVTQEDFTYASAVLPPGMDRRVSAAATETAGAAAAEQLAYDHLSNLTSRSETVPFLGGTRTTDTQLFFNAERNRVLRAASTGPVPLQSQYGYDSAGFVTQQSSTVGAVRAVVRFDWNARGQIVSIATNGAVEASFVYDALGRRRERFADGALRRWRFGGVVEADANDQPVAIDLGEVRIQLDGQHRYRHADWRGNTKLVSNASGKVETQHSFSAYGRRGTLGLEGRDFVFARGDALLVGAGELFLLGPRVYDPALGRFLSPDPIWSPVNLYAYTLGNPVDFADLSGLHAGSHHDLEQAQLAVGIQVLAVVGAAGLLLGATAAAPAAVVVGLGIGLTISVLWLGNALIELDQQQDLHRELSRQERGGSREPRGGYFGGGGGSAGGGGGRDPGPTEVVCSNDGSGWGCTRTPGGSDDSNVRIWLY